jgi:hypothetical protein
MTRIEFKKKRGDSKPVLVSDPALVPVIPPVECIVAENLVLENAALPKRLP